VQVANPFYGNVAVVEAPTNNCVTYVRYQRGEVGTPRGNPSTWIPSHPQDTVFRGYDVGRTPRPGALMVEGPNPRAGIGSAGHVSFVDQVRSDGSFHIVEGNWAGGFHDQWFYTDKPSRRAPAVFIYGRHR
jgi:surface antigen